MFHLIHQRLTALIATDGNGSTDQYEPDDVFDTHGLYVDLSDVVSGLSDEEFKEAAMERLEMPQMFCDDCGEVPSGKIEFCPDHLTEQVETMKTWGA